MPWVLAAAAMTIAAACVVVAYMAVRELRIEREEHRRTRYRMSEITTRQHAPLPAQPEIVHKKGGLGLVRNARAVAALVAAGAGWLLARTREHAAVTATVAAATMTGTAVLLMPWGDTAPMPGRVLPPDRGIRPDGGQSIAPPPTRAPDGRRGTATPAPLPLQPGMRVSDAPTVALSSPPAAPSLSPMPTPASARTPSSPTTGPSPTSHPPPVPTSPATRTPDPPAPTTDRPPPGPSPDDDRPSPEPDPEPEPDPSPTPKRCLLDVDLLIELELLCRTGHDADA